MIPRKLRVSPGEFLKESKVFFKSGLFTVKTKSNPLAYNRYAAVAAARAVKRAVDRHRFKRAVLQRAIHLPGKGRDYLFIAAPGGTYSVESLNRTFRELHTLINE